MFIFAYLIKMTIYLNMQKNFAQIRVHKRRPIRNAEVTRVKSMSHLLRF